MKFARLFRRNPLIFSGSALITFFIFAAIFSPWLAPHDPWQYQQAFLEPSPGHLLGTNDVGQDIFSELLVAGRVSLGVGFSAALMAAVTGVAIGILAGFRRGMLDEVLMGATDVVLVIPTLPLVVLISVYLGPSLPGISLLIGLIMWPSIARVIRSRVLSLRQAGFVESARALGAGDWWIMSRHVLPNVLPLVLAKFVLTLAGAMLIEASISFLGLGNPSAKSWGMMLHYAFTRGGFIREMWWWYLPPGLAIAMVIFALNLINLGFEEKSDPRLKKVLE
ncbi:MAG: ABC transporter permease [Dehalococcoidaceae bacterium]|nr:ABC transporter permease [Dehalococcoidaceae bacterium]